MEKWIYLKSNNPADAWALATVISVSNDVFHIVRRSAYSFFFDGLTNASLDFYTKSDDSQLFVIEPIESDLWQEKCKSIANNLGITSLSHYSLYLGFTKEYEEIEKHFGDNGSILLYLFPQEDYKFDLMIFDHLVNILNQEGYDIISGGSTVIPCIRGTKDMRQILNLQVLCSVKDKIKSIITSELFMKTIGEALNIKVNVISNKSEITIDNHSVSDAAEIANFIMINNK